MNNNIAAIRKIKNISQVELAEMAGIRGDTLCKIEKGRQRASTKLLEEIANILNVPIKDIFL